MVAHARRAHRRVFWLELILGALAVAVGMLVFGALASALGTKGLLLLSGQLAVLSLGLGGLLWRARQRRRQAGSDPQLAGWLDTLFEQRGLVAKESVGLRSAVEMLRDQGRYGESELLQNAAVTAAAQTLGQLDHRKVLGAEAWRRLRWHLLPLGVVLAAIFLVALLLPNHLRNAGRALASLTHLDQTLERVLPEPRLGDFRIHYQYPSYTQLGSRSVNSPNGAVRAYPGTEVTLETFARDDILEAALLISHGEDSEIERQAVKVEGRRLEARFVVSRGGHYRFKLRTADGEDQEERRGHELALDIDEPPEVTLLEPQESPLEVNENDRLNLLFSARDDFALGEAVVAWRVLGTAREGRAKLSSASAGNQRYSGSGQLDLLSLEVKPGDRIAYSVEVRDNDTVNGPKVGASETKELRIYSKKNHHQQVMALQQEALDELIHILGDNLEQALTDAADGYENRIKAVENIGNRARAADDLLARTIATSRKDPLGRKQVAAAFEQARRELAGDERTLRATVLQARKAWERAQTPDLPRTRAASRTQDQMVGSLEKNVVYLADLLDDQRLIDAEALAKELREQQLALKQALEAYKTAPTEEKRQAIRQAITEIKKRIDEIMQELAKLKSAIPQDFVNQDALDTGDQQASMDEVQKMLEEGDLDGAMQALERMLGQTEKMMASLKDGRDEMGSREYSEITEQAEKIWKDLEQLEKDQRDLAQRTEGMSKTVQERMQSKLGDATKFVEKQLQRLAEAQKQLERARPSEFMPNADLFEMAERRLQDGQRAMQGRDFGAAEEVLEQAVQQMRMLEQDARRRAEQARTFGDPFGGMESAQTAEKAMNRALPPVEDVLKDIQSLMPPPESLMTPEEKKQLGRLGERQNELEQKAEQLGKDLQKLGEQLPVVGPQIPGLLGEAQGAMGQAKGQLGQGNAPGALAQERSALEKLGQLKQQLEQMGQQGGSGNGVPLPFGQQPSGEGEEGGEGQRDISAERVQIPKPDQYKAPAEFREDILEAAKHGTVESYRDAVRRYYEELVK